MKFLHAIAAIITLLLLAGPATAGDPEFIFPPAAPDPEDVSEPESKDEPKEEPEGLPTYDPFNPGSDDKLSFSNGGVRVGNLGGFGGIIMAGLAYNATPYDEEQTHHVGFEAAGGMWVQVWGLRSNNTFFLDGTFGVGEGEGEHHFRFGFREDLGWYTGVAETKFGVSGSLGLLQMAVTTDGDVMWTPELGLQIDFWHVYARPALQFAVGSESGVGFGLTAGANILD